MKTLDSNRGKHCRGHALAEFLVSMIFFVPVFIAVPILGKYLDIKQKTIDASRYAVWERTIWSDRSASWNDSENQKSDAQVDAEIKRRLYGNPLLGLANRQQSSNVLWRNRKGQRLLLGSTSVVNESATPASTPLVDQIAYKGIPGLGALTSASNRVGNLVGKLVPGCRGAPGVDLQHGLNLGANNYVRVMVRAQVNNEMVSGPELDMRSHAAILSNAWGAPREGVFRQRVDRLVADEFVNCVTAPGRILIAYPLSVGTSAIFGEGKKSGPIDAAVSSRVLLPEYRR